MPLFRVEPNFKKAIEEVNPVTPGFYSTFFLKEGGGQSPMSN
jgi:hypothetical protein